MPRFQVVMPHDRTQCTEALEQALLRDADLLK